MTNPFVPADGMKSRKQHCIDLVRSLEPGSQIPLSEVMELCECGREAAWSAMLEAAEWLERNKCQSVETRKSFGWLVIGRDEAMLQKAHKRLEKTARAGNRTAGTALAVDREQLSQFGRQDHDQLVGSLAKVAEIRKRKTRSLAEIARRAKEGVKEISDPRVRQFPDRSQREGA